MITSKLPELEEVELNKLLLEYKKNSNSKIKNKIVKYNLHQVQKIAKSYSKSNKDNYEDLIQVGCLGLMSAIERFDPTQKASFKTYSSHFISGEIKHYLRDHTSLVKPPRELQELQPKINRIKSSLAIDTYTEENIKEISKLGDIPEDKVKQVLEMENATNIVYLDQPLQNSSFEKNTFIDQLEDKKYISFQLAQEDKIILNQAIQLIKDQSREVLEYAFYEDLSQTEIAKKMGISQMQVSRKVKSALKEVWEILNSRVTPW